MRRRPYPWERGRPARTPAKVCNGLQQNNAARMPVSR